MYIYTYVRTVSCITSKEPENYNPPELAKDCMNNVKPSFSCSPAKAKGLEM